MLKHMLFTVVAALGTLAFAASAQAAYLTLGTTNISNATTTLIGNSPAGAELLVKNTNSASTSAFGLYGLLTATVPTATAAAVRGHNSSTNARGYGVYGSQAGSGTGVYGYTPSGRGVWGASTGVGVRGSSSTGIGVAGQHLSGGVKPGVRGETNSTANYALGVYGLVAPASGANLPAQLSAAVLGENRAPIRALGVEGKGGSDGVGVAGFANNYSPSLQSAWPGGAGLWGVGDYGLYAQGIVGAVGEGSSVGVSGRAAGGPTSAPATPAGIRGVSDTGWGVLAESTSNYGVYGKSGSGAGVYAQSSTGDAISATSASDSGSGIYAEETGSSGRAGWFQGDVYITGTCTGCTGPSALHIDDPLDPAHKYLQHSSVASSQQLDVYSGNVTTNGKGFATVAMPRWFQALNRSFRYQLTSLSGLQEVAVAKKMHSSRFTIQSQRPHSEVSWQVTAVRHDRYAKAHPIRVVAPKAKKDQGKYVHPELYGKPKSDGIGYRKPPSLPHKPVVRR